MKKKIKCIRPAGDQSFFRLVEDKGSHWIGIWDGETEIVPIYKTTVCTSWEETPHT